MKTAERVMTRDLITVHPNLGLQEFASLLEEKKISGCPVVSDTGEVLGVVSKTDLTRARATGDDLVDLFYRSSNAMVGGDAVLDLEYGGFPYDEEEDMEEEGLGELHVRDVMNKSIYTVGAKESIATVARHMIEQKIHRLLVTDKGKFVGIVTTTDLLRAMSEMTEDAAVQVEAA